MGRQTRSDRSTLALLLTVIVLFSVFVPLGATGANGENASQTAVDPADSAFEEVIDSNETSSGILEGRITEAINDEPIENATIELYDDNELIAKQQTDETGIYEFDDLGSGEYDLVISAIGFEDNEETGVSVSGDSRTERHVSLTGNATVNGMVQDMETEEVLADATVTVDGPYGPFEATTDDDGSFEIEHVPGTGSEYTVEADADNYVSWNVSIPINSGTIETVNFGLEPMAFDIALEKPVEPIDAGDSAEFDATVTNEAIGTVTETVALEINGIQQDTETLDLEGGESTDVSLEWKTDDGDNGIHEATVIVGNSAETTSIEVLETSHLAVDIIGTNDLPDENLIEFIVDIDNVGNTHAEQTITLDVEELGTDATTVSVDGGESTTVVFPVSLDGATDGKYTATVESEDDSSSTVVEVGSDGPIFEFGELDVPAEISVDADHRLRIPVRNVGYEAGTARIRLTVAGETATETVPIEPGTERPVAVPIPVPSDPGTYELILETEDDEYRTELTTVGSAAGSESDENSAETDARTDESDQSIETDGEDDQLTATTNESEDDEVIAEFDAQPGFGVPAAIVALLVAFVAARVRT